MILNYESALSADLLSLPQKQSKSVVMPIVHFGVGGFHRAHQAWALQNLKNNFREKYADWGICGLCILPGDLPFVEALRVQDCLYFVQSFAADGSRHDVLVSAIKELLHPIKDYAAILDKIASDDTKVISFTITEGGYNVDYDKHIFIWETPSIQSDLKRADTPQTIFRILAEGLRQRMEAGAQGIALMSCDNVQHNGDILRFALLEFLKKFDRDLIIWVEEHVSFVKTMVDRITPVASTQQKNEFAASYGLEDRCLVVCEDFFQWVIQDDPRLKGLPYEAMGATLVEDVAPYEKMKLRLLNGGHSLTGLLGELLGYDRIHTAIADPLIKAVYIHYCQEEVMDTLDEIQEVHYMEYINELVRRFSNPMINDSTARIISGSTDKLPKFVLPVISDQLAAKSRKIKWGMLIIAAWYYYLATAFKRDEMAMVVDQNKETLLELFRTDGFDAGIFWDNGPGLEAVRSSDAAQSLFVAYVQGISNSDIQLRRLFIHQLLES
ncbi:mannitol dehydrogenase family protein [Arachidicoccus terrestris]|uniref:mannitol dehydrogenase family protein n=1 Tax=Arachidicoccus terrestris TaxID=2875539 RepID=UPI001CC6B1CD|nr:mannitol dehydrogenase family protein [Arachidicoccus terrestris]UAY56947.1 mannitol dehydrogenase family protein [Arachidicoccus terrestris]